MSVRRSRAFSYLSAKPATGAPLLLMILVSLAASPSAAQRPELTVDMIMQDPDTWVGAWPSKPFWNESGDTLFFRWNPQGRFESDSLFRVDPFDPEAEPVKLTSEERRSLGPTFNGWHHGEHIYDAGFFRKVYAKNGDVFVYDVGSAETTRLTRTRARESAPRFRLNGDGVVFRRGMNLWAIDRSGATIQLTDLRAGEPPDEPDLTDQDVFLREQQEALLEVIRERKRDEEAREAQRVRDEAAEDWPPPIYVGEHDVEQLQIDPTERFATFILEEEIDESPETIVPAYVTESGYVESIEARPKVGYPTSHEALYVQDLAADTTYRVDLAQVLDHASEAGQMAGDTGESERREKQAGASATPRDVDLSRSHVSDTTQRRLYAYGPYWSADGAHAVVEIRAWDNKDRWIADLDPETAELRVIDHQHDEAWLQAPGIASQGGRSTMGWLPDDRTFFFHSERSGRSHLYAADLETGEVHQLTQGDFDVYDALVSKDGRSWFFTSSEGSPYERHFYTMPIEGGERTRFTKMEGHNDTALSPDEQTLAVLHSYTNRPPEVYVRPIDSDSERRITHSTTPEWAAYDWREAEIVAFEAADGVDVPAQLFIPEDSNGSAVLFVHGAGYLQNVHRWWSSYFREYMFHNLLADLGYTVMNVDYRGSSGYGRDWRTSVYRHMGGRDLQDYVDASRFLAEEHGIDPERTFIYGGSYGGFITLMALFTEPAHFGGGAALRSVTDWAHYHYGYTANILNTPMEDSLAFARSSPIYFAEGLEDPLLIAHGMVDDNVHFQDVVRLAQRLIELGKRDWEMAIYPVEEHGFQEPASWADEYRRILKYIRLSVGPPDAALLEVPVLRDSGPRIDGASVEER